MPAFGWLAVAVGDIAPGRRRVYEEVVMVAAAVGANEKE